MNKKVLLGYISIASMVAAIITASLKLKGNSSEPANAIPASSVHENVSDSPDYRVLVGSWEVDEFSSLEFKEDGQCFFDTPPFPYKGFYKYNPENKTLELEMSFKAEPGQEDKFEKDTYLVEFSEGNLVLQSTNSPSHFRLQNLKRKGN